MIKYIKNIDTFSKNIVLVFLGTSMVNLFNLLYQLLIAHRLSPGDFAAFNSLLSIFMLISVPSGTLQVAVVKYSAEFSAQNQIIKLRVLLSNLLRKTVGLAIITFFIFCLSSFYIMDKLKIASISSGFILAILLALSWITPVFSGAVQGLGLFKWLTLASVITGGLKLALAFIFILSGFNIAGALGALLVSGIIGLIIYCFPLRDFFSLKTIQDDIDFKELFLYLFPVAISSFCFISLVSFDMVLVKYFFSSEDSGIYSLAQIVGKIFLFLPGAISLVMFPKTSGLNAINSDTASILKKSLFYALSLCVFTGLIYNLMPSFILKILTGKMLPESVTLGRLFSLSMTFFALLFVLINYMLSIKDLRFIKYLVLFTGLQFLGIMLFHRSLYEVQLILCINAVLLFAIHLLLAYRKGTHPQAV